MPENEEVRRIMRDTGMGLMQAINHLRQRTLLQETHKVVSWAMQQERKEHEEHAMMLAQMAIAKAAAR